MGGSQLVGLLLGSPPAEAEQPVVELVSPIPGKAARICVRVITRDGLFWSDNPFRIPVIETPRIQAGPIADVHREAFLTYSPAEVMVRAAVPTSADCSNLAQVDVYAPAVGVPDGSLRVYVNTHGRAAGARLRRLGDPPTSLASTRCRRFETGPTVAADRICTLEIPRSLSAGIYELHVRILDAVSSEDLYYAVRIPDAR